MKLQFPGSITKYTYLQSHSRCRVGSFLTPGFKMWFQQTNTAEVLDGVSLSLSLCLSSLFLSFSLFFLFFQGKDSATLFNLPVPWMVSSLAFSEPSCSSHGPAGNQVASHQHRLASAITLLLNFLKSQMKTSSMCSLPSSYWTKANRSLSGPFYTTFHSMLQMVLIKTISFIYSNGFISPKGVCF